MSDTTILIPLSVVLSVGSPIVAALVAAIVWLAKAKDAIEAARVADIKAANEARERAEQGRLDDLRASSALVRETQERMLPVLERVAVEMRIRNERAARRAGREPDSDPPARSSHHELEDTATRLRRLANEADELARGGNLNGARTP